MNQMVLGALLSRVVTPSWVLTADGTIATILADFTTEGISQHYWYNGRQYPGFTSFLTGLGGTFSGSANGTYVNSAGLITQATANTARFDYNPSTLAAKGILLEGARTNVVLWNRDLTNAAWTASNVTVAKDQTGADGVANSASSLTATAGNGTVLQAITLASSARYQSAYVKRLTGSGTINMTMDNGTTWTAISPTSSWTALEIPTQTLANPTVGFRIVTSGDAIAVDYVQNENGAFRSSAIPTTSASVTRAADSLSFPYTQTTFSALIETINIGNISNGARLLSNNNNEGLPMLNNTTTANAYNCLLYTSPSPRDGATSRMPSSA